jgi:hypothetical protein
MEPKDGGKFDCQECGEVMEMQHYWYGSTLQLIWHCCKCKCGYVRDIYKVDASPFSDELDN